jgi:hypothetical protein
MKNGHALALEYFTYYCIRFDKHPNLKKITEGLQKAADDYNSSRACNTIAEFAHA